MVVTWAALRGLGVGLPHTGPVKRAGGVRETRLTPTEDGRFDRISLDLDPALGTEAEYAALVAAAERRRAGWPATWCRRTPVEGYCPR